MVLLWLVALQIGKEKALVDEKEYDAYIREIKESISDIPETVNQTKAWVKAHKDWATIPQFLVIGGGMNYGAAEEAVLKMMETMCVLGTVCEIGEFSHGVHRAISNQSNVFTIMTKEYGYDDMVKINEYLEDKVARLLVIDATESNLKCANVISVKERPLTASALNIAVVFQVLAAALPEVLGYDPNRASHNELTKVVATRD